ncbi:Glycine--tRNA ligase 1, mitochondrial [Actinomortierella ambigua]|uniref:glycine--tRNA ligase n=1 Tax=Actinomortierella ambigua TaxID=1343610 RepID=A0A9P6QIB6_9FUNG|nr:Glycine--tRNA ligase 1, mitochondrial [Actinomortierella ambigua]KAG0266556.1 Glycine--tRNA ligase 1, mitochondrial [Actinomortierella ambigua]
MSTSAAPFNRSALEQVLLKRFFYAPAFAIYGGVAGLYDYGPPGCALQANVLDIWRKHFVLEEDMLEVDCSIMTPAEVLKTSGHVDRFSDWMCKDLKSGEIFRADHLVENVLEARIEGDAIARNQEVEAKKVDEKKKKKAAKVSAVRLDDQVVQTYKEILAQIDNYSGPELGEIMRTHQIKSPETGNDLSEPQVFNLMFASSIGPTGQFPGYLRPETAQGQFLNFKRLLEYNNDRMPFASAQIGRSFRNEISPREGLLRVREFTMAEIEHYVDPAKKDHPRFKEVSDYALNILPASVQLQGKTDLVKITVGEAVKQKIIDNETLGYFLVRIHQFLVKIGINADRVRFRQHMANEMAHYACDCWDAEIHTSFGWKECVGCADRSAYDLTVHSNKTGEKLVVRERLPEPLTEEKLQIEVNKKVFGPRFKKNAKVVEDHLTGLDQCTLEGLKKSFDDKDSFSVNVNNEDFEVTKDLIAKFEKVSVTTHIREYTPNVIEPSFGIGRILYALMEHVYYVRPEDEQRGVLGFPPVVAPTKCLLVPLSSNEAFVPALNEVSTLLRKAGVSNKVDDSGAAIGRRYARNDELGTPFGITIDFQTVQDGTITLRERDSTKQIREKMSVIVELVKDMCEGRTTWEEVQAKYPAFVGQEVSE